MGVQLLALLVLAAVLLPVISLTDDLQAARNPAETERVARRVDSQPSPDQPLHPVPVALALLVATAVHPQWAEVGVPSAPEPVSRHRPGFSRVFTTRPPPAV